MPVEPTSAIVCPALTICSEWTKSFEQCPYKVYLLFLCRIRTVLPYPLRQVAHITIPENTA
jgi:hypothetical protein